MTVRVASTPVSVTRLVQPPGSSDEVLLDEGDEARLEEEEATTELTEGTGTVTPSLVSVGAGEVGLSVVVIDTPSGVDSGCVALRVVVMLTPAPGVVKGVGPSSVWPSVVEMETTPPSFSGVLLGKTGTGIASGVVMTVVLPSSYVCVTTMVVMLVSKTIACEEDAVDILDVLDTLDKLDGLDDTSGNPGAVVAVWESASIVVVMDTSLGERARTVVAAAEELALLEADDVPIQPHHFQHCQLRAFLSNLIVDRSA